MAEEVHGFDLRFLSQIPCHLCPENTFMCWCSGASVTPGKACVARGLIILPPSPAHLQSASARRVGADSRTALSWAFPTSSGPAAPLWPFASVTGTFRGFFVLLQFECMCVSSQLPPDWTPAFTVLQLRCFRVCRLQL